MTINIDKEEEDNRRDTETPDQIIMTVLRVFNKALLELKNKNAPRINGIPVELMKNCGENTQKIILRIDLEEL